ncbi:MAG: hypothetical protein M1378_10445 [Bacteroidetes bacterium]|nr:hypothetical protein [Bacteroidota bacterium]
MKSIIAGSKPFNGERVLFNALRGRFIGGRRSFNDDGESFEAIRDPFKGVLV